MVSIEVFSLLRAQLVSESCRSNFGRPGKKRKGTEGGGSGTYVDWIVPVTPPVWLMTTLVEQSKHAVEVRCWSRLAVQPACSITCAGVVGTRHSAEFGAQRD